MRIEIAQRLRPFSHQPGTTLVIPGSDWLVQCFPALLRLQRGVETRDIPLTVTSPVEQYTICQDLEDGCIRIWHTGEQGFVRYRLARTDAGAITLTYEKGGPDQTVVVAESAKELPKPTERLSLGSHRHLDWDKVRRDGDLHAIVPVWMRLGQWVPTAKPAFSGTASLLRELLGLAPEKVAKQLQHVLRAGFHGLLAPRLVDEDHQGYQLPALNTDESPLVLLSEGSRLLRALFVRQDENRIQLLPLMPPEFHCGRFVNVQCPSIGVLNIEWTKKKLRRMTLQAETSDAIQFAFPRSLRSFRLRTSLQDHGFRQNCQDPVNVVDGQRYILDQFIC